MLIVCMMGGIALADEWYPFGLTSSDSFEAARAKVKAATGVEYHETYTYSSAQPANVKMDGVPVEMFLVNHPAGTEWRLTIVLKPELMEYDKLYDIYEMLVLQLGEPISVEPMTTSMSFSGTSDKVSPFANKADFMTQAINNFPSDYTVTFPNVTYRITEGWSTGTKLSLYFDCPKE